MDDDYDAPWKEVVTRYFPEFMAFYFPDAHALIDWSRPYDFLDQELAALSRDAAVGKRILDKLVRVHLRDGGEQWVLVHLEVQGWRDGAFAERIFTYHYRVYDRYRRPVASLAVLADSGRDWRPASFVYRLLGCEMRLAFPIVKLQDHADRLPELLAHQNPFALVTAAHLLTQQTKRHAGHRHAAKWCLTKLLYQRRWDRQRIIDFYHAIDWMMRLPEALDLQFREDVLELERRESMPYINNFERAGRKIGRQEGLQEGRQEGRSTMLAELLVKRFGALDPGTLARLATADAERLSGWGLKLLDARTLDEVFRD
ncbi:hypothetical protein SAMN05216319_2588 [Duganella sp. CF402]|uniref:DUF4351 domain-containing protein n=1 Tax=unclassified Duganella TaxID=2636909 RepID=UPI0008D36B11|nr:MULTISPECIES: DUF4351 domain-containing protein [unclassified Duganella]RZT08992.1 hypothetical protein EV582_1033 [Duganella sp. BK701]SEL74488.1 hypothetical protein SAMN05216319_2588 [Duganella sp. CF402]